MVTWVKQCLQSRQTWNGKPFTDELPLKRMIFILSNLIVAIFFKLHPSPLVPTDGVLLISADFELAYLSMDDL